MALRALATRAGEAGRELLGVHTQLHQQAQRVDAAERTADLLQEGFNALTDAQDGDREVTYALSTGVDKIEERQVRILRRTKNLKIRLEKEVTATREMNAETAKRSKVAFDELRAKNMELQSLVESLEAKNQWFEEALQTTNKELETTKNEVREQNKLTVRLVCEMERITAAVDGIDQRQRIVADDLMQRVDDSFKTNETNNVSFHETMQEATRVLNDELQRKSEEMNLSLRACVKRQSMLRASVDDALTALATELRASLSMTQAVEKKCESIVDGMSTVGSDNNMRFDVISQAIQALAAVIDTR